MPNTDKKKHHSGSAGTIYAYSYATNGYTFATSNVANADRLAHPPVMHLD